MLISLAYAQQTAAPVPGLSNNAIMQFAPMILIFIVFYFLMIMPQQKKAKEHEKMLKAIKRGDRVLTTGGIYATVWDVKGNVVEVKINDDTKIDIIQSAIVNVIVPETQSVAIESGKK